mmetsp:Transcript_8277/g.26450  ORF Transcript_8277/g.26450 Transcript_8277/m.26450 type:complete len:264 (-) Transcript_8277:45-836(-)
MAPSCRASRPWTNLTFAVSSASTSVPASTSHTPTATAPWHSSTQARHDPSPSGALRAVTDSQISCASLAATVSSMDGHSRAKNSWRTERSATSSVPSVGLTQYSTSRRSCATASCNVQVQVVRTTCAKAAARSSTEAAPSASATAASASAPVTSSSTASGRRRPRGRRRQMSRATTAASWCESTKAAPTSDSKMSPAQRGTSRSPTIDVVVASSLTRANAARPVSLVARPSVVLFTSMALAVCSNAARDTVAKAGGDRDGSLH